MRDCLPPLLALLLLVSAGSVGSADTRPQQVTIYRCTGPDGALALRDTPCRNGERQQAIEMQRPKDPPPRPPPASASASPAAVAPVPEKIVTHVVVLERLAPLYECTAPDGETYTSDSPAGNPRWVPLWTLGYPARPPYAYPRRSPINVPARPATRSDHLGNDLVFDGIGRPSPPPPGDPQRAPRLPPSVGLAYTPGTWVRDTCQLLPPAEACQRLRDRHWELGRRYNSALQSERAQIDAEQGRINARLGRECTQ